MRRFFVALSALFSATPSHRGHQLLGARVLLQLQDALGGFLDQAGQASHFGFSR